MCDKGEVLKIVLKFEKQCYKSVSIVKCNETKCFIYKCVVYTSDQEMSSTEQLTTTCQETQIDATTMQDKRSEAYRCVLQSSDIWTV